ncbi:hypothetical protein DL93DRAFT_2072085 [Clavulina sp. PMI_390]|nr:hypothetical protein DL93DRAFT_2072085 [Clavulina sp. PMI_390]
MSQAGPIEVEPPTMHASCSAAHSGSKTTSKPDLSAGPRPPYRTLCASTARHDVHMLFKHIFAPPERTRMRYLTCLLCPFKVNRRNRDNVELQKHFLQEHIVDAVRHYAKGKATSIETFLAYHYVCATEDAPRPRIQGYDEIGVVKEREQFYWEYRSYIPGHTITPPTAERFPYVHQHVLNLADVMPFWSKYARSRRTPWPSYSSSIKGATRSRSICPMKTLQRNSESPAPFTVS